MSRHSHKKILHLQWIRTVEIAAVRNFYYYTQDDKHLKIKMHKKN